MENVVTVTSPASDNPQQKVTPPGGPDPMLGPSEANVPTERPERIPQPLWDSLSTDVRIVLAQFAEENRLLWERIRELEARSKQNSSNSSLPGSKDRPWDKPTKRRKARGGKRGGQKGHPPRVRELLPPERVQTTHDVYPTDCKHCKCGAPPERGDEEDGSVEPHQVVDLPAITPEVAEYRLHSGVCARCGKRTRASLPAGVPAGTFGPRIQALISILAVAYHLSKRQIKSLLGDLLDIDISVGAVVDAQARATEALAEPVAEVHEALKQSTETAYQDETTWPEAGKKGYAWVTASGPYAYYEIAHSRSGEVARRQLDGPAYRGTVVTDRYAAYKCYPMENRGICHSHLMRDYQKIADRGEHVKEIGESLLELERRIFHAWHEYQDGRIDRVDLQFQLVGIAEPYQAALHRGMANDDSKVAGMCKNIHGHWEAIWNFGWVDGMEPTNNEAERTARVLVVWRNKCQGTQSALGSLFVSRMATVIETCRRQARSAYDFLVDAFAALVAGTKPPSLVVSNSS